MDTDAATGSKRDREQETADGDEEGTIPCCCGKHLLTGIIEEECDPLAEVGIGHITAHATAGAAKKLKVVADADQQAEPGVCTNSHDA